MKLTTLIIGFFLLFSCGDDVSETSKEEGRLETLTTRSNPPQAAIKIIEPTIDEVVVLLQNNGITLTEIKSVADNSATLTLNTQQFKMGENQLSFSVEGRSNYPIAYLANNTALSRFSSTVFNVELLYGNNVFLAFLTDNNKVSIKTNKGSVLRNAVLGGVNTLFDTQNPHLFYHLPAAKTSHPILDFYLVNTAISADGNKVKVTINETEFIITKWAAYQVEGVPNGKNTVRLQLLNQENLPIEGPFNDSGERYFSVSSEKL